MNFLTQLLIFVVTVALSLAVVEGCQTCSDVCPSYQHWYISETCPGEAPGGGMEVCGDATCTIYPKGGCVCNVFGCDCTPCYCQGRRTTTHEAKNSCEDYHTYMNMTRREKVEHLASFHCTNSNSTSGEVVRRLPRKSIDTIVEMIADVNNDGNLTCEEFNNAYFELDGFEHLCLE